MRIRTVKPDFWIDEDLAELSIHSRLAFIGLWNLADADGIIQGTSKLIKAQLFPYDSFTTNEVDTWINELANHSKKFIVRYMFDGREYIKVSRFTQHQRPDPREKSKNYPQPNNDETLSKHCLDIDSSEQKQCANGMDTGILDTGILDTCLSENTVGSDEPKNIFSLTDQKVFVSKPKKERSTSAPDTFEISESVKSWLEKNSYPIEWASAEIESFLNSHKSKGNRFVCWDSAFRTWITNGIKFDSLDKWKKKNSLPAVGSSQPMKFPAPDDPDYERKVALYSSQLVVGIAATEGKRRGN